MKISYRILLINFAIVALILGSSAFAFYSIMYNVLSSQQSKQLTNSTNDFVYAYRQLLQNSEDEFILISQNELKSAFKKDELEGRKIDFIFKVAKSRNGVISDKVFKNNVVFKDNFFSVKSFLNENPYAILQNAEDDNYIYYFGRILSGNILDDFSRKIGADIAMVIKNTPLEFSNGAINQKYFFVLTDAYKNLVQKNNLDIYSEGSSSSDIVATLFKPSGNAQELSDISFLIFTNIGQAAALRSGIQQFLIIIGLCGVVLSLILSFLFTDKFRKQIAVLNKATEATKNGDFKGKIELYSKDELGDLAGAFNTMLDELDKNQKAKTEYSEFITLINRNPSLGEIAEAALRKIIKTCNFTIGALYSVDENRISLTSSYGIKKDLVVNNKNSFFESVIKKQETLELTFTENFPSVSTGTLVLEIKNLLILPVIYNGKVIAILEIGAIDKPTADAKEYLSKIQEQLAIGLTNAKAVSQLENLVSELKQLNEDYQKQNLQVRKQNEILVDLHHKLEEKADELEIQKRKAEESTQLKSQFLASMSHELRTPMNSILGLTELILEESTLKGKNRERIEVVLKSGKRLMTLINDILDLSKIEAGKMEIHNEEFLLEDLIQELDASISPLVFNKNINFIIHRLINTKIIISSDRGKIIQVLINLLGNAVKFTEKGQVELSVNSQNNTALIFEVKDSGVGISEENQKIVFEEFRQLDGTTTRKHGGTGLGLAICKKIADLFNGTLSVASEINSGSTFTFTVPLNFVEVKESYREVKVNVETLRKNIKNPILVIDDDEEVRYTIGQYLISRGYEVIYAEDGIKGIQEAKKIQPFAITLDVMLPNKDGWNVLRELKEDPVTKDIPVILISILGDKNIGYGLGAFEYFVKPISADILLNAFTKLESLANKRIEKIVIVDDDELEFEKFKREFKNETVRIEYIKDSEFAFSKILEVQPDLIILDLIMPKIDGISLSYKLKAHVETKHIPIIMSTAKELSEEEKDSLQNIVEQITVKSKGHPLDVLKVVRDRIKMLESYTKSLKPFDAEEETNTEETDEDEISGESCNDEYRGDILIVDDDPDTLYTVCEIVNACGCRTISAKSGEECLEVLESKIPDIILLDIMMPDMDGFQTLKKIRANSRWANIPVFAVTAKAMLDDKAIILKHGFDDYISKPVNAGVMAFKIEKFFTKLKLADNNEKDISYR